MRHNQLRLKRAASAIGSLALAVAAAPSAQAEDTGWNTGDVVVRLGAAAIDFNEKAKVTIAGAPVPGGNADISNNATLSSEVEYFFAPSMSAAVNFGLPLTADVDGAGTLAPARRLGQVRYGIGAVVARYHFAPRSPFSPYLGVGVGRFFSFSEHDGAVTSVEVSSAWGAVAQAGADFHLTRSVGLFANASFAPIDVKAKGFLGPAPVRAKVRLDPVVFQAGASFRF